jgi:hypothetical protein
MALLLLAVIVSEPESKATENSIVSAGNDNYKVTPLDLWQNKVGSTIVGLTGKMWEGEKHMSTINQLHKRLFAEGMGLGSACSERRPRHLSSPDLPVTRTGTGC